MNSSSESRRANNEVYVGNRKRRIQLVSAKREPNTLLSDFRQDLPGVDFNDDENEQETRATRISHRLSSMTYVGSRSSKNHTTYNIVTPLWRAFRGLNSCRTPYGQRPSFP